MSTYLSLDPVTVSIFLKLSAAILCGVILGTERIIAHKTAGMRTYALASMGAALFVIIGDLMLAQYAGISDEGPSRIAAAIVTGIGFMGAGVIVLRGSNLTGITTASGLWVAAGIGMACGFGFYVPALMATILTLFIFIVLWRIEQRIKKLSPEDTTTELS